jgi:hypothetical protein
MTGLAVRVEISDPRIRVRYGVAELVVEMEFCGHASTVTLMRAGRDMQGRLITLETLQAALAGIMIDMEELDER